MVEKALLSKDNIFTIIALIDKLDEKVAHGTLCAKDIWDVWRRERALENHRRPVKIDQMPRALRSELQNRAVDVRVSNLCIAWDAQYGIPLPRIATWLLDQGVGEDRRITFEGLEMDRAALVRELLDDKFFGLRVRREMVEYPYLLNFLPEDERWERFSLAVREHASVCSWRWPAYTAKQWSKERTMEEVRVLIKDPEVASSFLLGEFAPAFAWRIFWDLDIFFYVLGKVGRVAPYELALAHQWIATCIGDRVSHINGPSCLDERPTDESYPWYGWWMEPSIVHKEFGPKGMRLMGKLVDDTLEGLLDRDVSELSALSQYFVRQAQGVQEKMDDPQTARTISELLIGMPESMFAARLIVPFLERCKREYLGQAFRWVLSARKCINPTRFHVLVHQDHWADTAAYEDVYPAQLAEHVWVERVFRVAMEAFGWQFYATSWRRNERYNRWDLQVVVKGERVTRVYGMWWRGPSMFGDYLPMYPTAAKSKPPQLTVMIPPDFKPGEPQFVNEPGTFEIYHVRDTLELALPWSYSYLSKYGG